MVIYIFCISLVLRRSPVLSLTPPKQIVCMLFLVARASSAVIGCRLGESPLMCEVEAMFVLLCLCLSMTRFSVACTPPGRLPFGRPGFRLTMFEQRDVFGAVMGSLVTGGAGRASSGEPVVHET